MHPPDKNLDQQPTQKKPAASIASAAVTSVLGFDWKPKPWWATVLLSGAVFTLILWNWSLSDRLAVLQKQANHDQQTFLQQDKNQELAFTRQGERLAQLEANLVTHVASGLDEAFNADALAQVDVAITAVRQWQKHYTQQTLPKHSADNPELATGTQATATAINNISDNNTLPGTGITGYWHRTRQWLGVQWQTIHTATLATIGSWVRVTPLPSLAIAQGNSNTISLAENGLLQSLFSARLALLARQDSDATQSLRLAQQQATLLFAPLRSEAAQTAHQVLTLALQKALQATEEA